MLAKFHARDPRADCNERRSRLHRFTAIVWVVAQSWRWFAISHFTADDAQWGFPEIKLGCYPPVACTALAALVGQKRAAELILTGRTISGIEAAEIGLANRAVPESQLTGTVEGIIDEFVGLSPAALAFAKKANYAWDSMHFDKGLARAEKIYLDELMKTADAQEGIQAFMEKRQPKWTGK